MQIFKLFETVGIQQETVKSCSSGFDLIFESHLFLLDVFGELCELVGFVDLLIEFGVHGFSL